MKGIAFLSGLISGLVTLGITLPGSCEVLSDGTTNKFSILKVEDGALVTVRHDSLGDAGKIQINANSVTLNN